jgi:acetylornithine aminotransferase
MGGQPLCAAAALATMKLIEDEDLTTRANVLGEQITQRILDAGIGKVQDVRGAGLMIGIPLDCPGKDFLMGCLERGVIINYTQDTVLRLAPPLTIDEDTLAQGLDVLIDVLKA